MQYVIAFICAFVLAPAVGLLKGTHLPSMSDVVSLINSMNETINNQGQAISSLRHTVDEQINTIGTLNHAIEKQTNQINLLSQTVHGLNNTVGHQSPIAFFAVLSTDRRLGDLQAIEFDHVVTNLGNGYDVRHGHFVCPVKGLYVFSISILTYSGEGLVVQLVKNGNEIARLYSDDEHQFESSKTAFDEMNVGDMVWAREMSGKSGERIYGSSYPSFGGALIR